MDLIRIGTHKNKQLKSDHSRNTKHHIVCSLQPETVIT